MTRTIRKTPDHPDQTTMKTPLIDLCFYFEPDLKAFLEMNPELAQTTRIKDDRGRFHLLLRCGNAPWKKNTMKNKNGKTIGYWRYRIAKINPAKIKSNPPETDPNAQKSTPTKNNVEAA